MFGTTSASIDGVSDCTSPGRLERPASGRSRSLSTPSASSPITTTMRGWTIAISSTTRAMQAGSASEGSATGHFTHSVP